MLIVLSNELGKLPNKISLEGHTDAHVFNRQPNYSNWELSTDRANASRRLMMQNGLRADQLVDVRGFADQRLRNRQNPEDASNRRISILVKYLEKEATGEAAPVTETPAKTP